MKAIIDGKLYDTDTAEELGSWVKENAPGSPIIELYRSPGGAYFIHVMRDFAYYELPRKGLFTIKDDRVVDVVVEFGGVDEALRLFPERIEMA